MMFKKGQLVRWRGDGKERGIVLSDGPRITDDGSASYLIVWFVHQGCQSMSVPDYWHENFIEALSTGGPE